MTREQYLLYCLAEEAGEVTQAIMKVLRFGLDKHGRNRSNLDDLQDEIADFVGVLNMLADAKIINLGEMNIKSTEKKDKVESFMPEFDDE